MNFSISEKLIAKISAFLNKHAVLIIGFILSVVSVVSFVFFYRNGLGLAYNDARSHLDIGRRVVEGLKPGIAQLGSVWLPLNHILMVPLIWNDFMWHTGLAGAIWSMISYVATSIVIYKFLEKIKVGPLGRVVGVLVFAANLNILYLQSTAMTELLLLGTMTIGSYYLLLWAEDQTILNLIKSAFWIMLSTLVRYDGWFLLLFAAAVVALMTFIKKGYKKTEGTLVLFLTLAGLGIVLWFVWNWAIFKDPLYFALGPFSAHAQQQQLLDAGNLATKGNVILSFKVYLYALAYNSYTLPVIFAGIGAILLWINKKIDLNVKFASAALLAPLAFNIIALFLGFSVLFIQGISGNTWFNVRYGIMLVPTIAIFIGYLVDQIKGMKWVIVGLTAIVIFVSFTNTDAVTIDDARVGSSQKNVSQVAIWLEQNTKDKPGFILISAASHDAIIFSSGLPMSKFIHEGTGDYWKSATTTPDHWARWIVMRTYDESDLTYRTVSKSAGFANYTLVDHFPFADIYEIKPEYVNNLETKPVFPNQK